MLIGLCGRIGSGKTEVARIVKELYPEMYWQEKGFADKLRRVAYLLTGIPDDMMKEQEVKEQVLGGEWDDVETKIISGNTYRWPITLRVLLQRLGTQAIRDGLHKNAWVNALMCDYKSLGISFKPGGPKGGEPTPLPNWLVCDTRFPNELEAITSRGGTCIRIVRPDNPYPQSTHESETALDGVELVTIINDGNIEQLKLKVKWMFDPIVKNLGK